MSMDLDRVVVAESDLQDAINTYNKCKNDFQNAYLQMSNAVRQADTIWHGQASETFKDKFNQMYNNIVYTEDEVQASVDLLNKALEVYAETEQRGAMIVESMNVGTNPWA